MKKDCRNSLAKSSKQMLKDHLKIGRGKSVSYLPINTVEAVIGISIETYAAMIEQSGYKYAIFTAKDCCIKSGAMYAYDYRGLKRILDQHRTILRSQEWPTTPHNFIKRIASKWLDQEDPVMPVIRMAFGDR